MHGIMFCPLQNTNQSPQYRITGGGGGGGYGHNAPETLMQGTGIGSRISGIIYPENDSVIKNTR